MPVRILHAGLHKSGSTFLQKTGFSALAGVNYLGGFNLAGYLKNGPDDASRVPLISSEACLGFPNPVTNGPNFRRLDYLMDLLSISHVILVERNFDSWVRSLYFQVLKEGGTASFDDWLAANTGLDKWRDVVGDLRQRLAARQVQLLVLSQEQLFSDRDGFVARLCEFVGVDCPEIPAGGMHNVFRYGNVTLIRLANRILPNSAFCQMLRDPRDLLLFGLGKLTEALSWRRPPAPSGRGGKH